MRFSSALKSRYLFLYSGVGLILLAFLLLPMRTAVMIGIDLDCYWTGWIFAPVIGAWGLTSVTLGITESSPPKKYALLCFLPVFVLIYIGLGFASWMVMTYGANWFWRFYFGLLLFPCLIANTVGVFYFTKKEKLANILKNKRTKILMLIALIAVPLVYTATLLLLFIIFA